jgi:hypothetical protein
MSIGGFCSAVVADAINYATFDVDKPVVIVAASGNTATGVMYPAKQAPVIAVGATDHNDERAYFSNRGEELDVVAPGVGIWSTVPENGYDAFSGTSMASPHVAGIAGLLLAQRPALSAGQVREILRQSADDLGDDGFDRYYGHGRVNAYQALQTETPEEPEPPERAECPDSPCGATMAVSGEADAEDLLRRLRDVRDQVFAQDPGRRWVRVYYANQFEVAWLIATDSQLRADALAGIRAFDPVFQALIGDQAQASPFVLTWDHVAAAERALMGLAEHGSPEIHDAIVGEWAKVDPYRFVGWEVQAVWEQLRAEERPKRIHLPFVINPGE